MQIRRFHDGRTGIIESLSGEHLDRWALKVLAGMLSSGNFVRKSGMRAQEPPPEQQLGIMSGEETVPDGWSLYLLLSPKATTGNRSNSSSTRVRQDQTRDRSSIVTIRVLGLYFSCAMTALSSAETLWHRPTSIHLGRLVRVDLQWSASQGFLKKFPAELRYQVSPV
jgi:hypothetical protein